MSAGEKLVNPQLHDEFIALCALFFSGELTDEEWALLQVHLAYCDSCRKTFEEFQHLHQDVVPAMAAAAAAEQPAVAATGRFSLDEAERRLMQELDRPNAPGRKQPSSKIKWSIAAGLIGVAAVGSIWLSLQINHSKPAPRLEASVQRNPIVRRAPAIPVKEAVAPIKRPLQVAQADAAEKLRRELNSANSRYKQLNVTVKDMEQQLAALQAQEQQASNEKVALQQQLVQVRSKVRTLLAGTDTLNAASRQQALRLVNLQTTVDVLNSSLDEKNRMLALDKQFLGHDREIRNLIAARHLYIADIYDVKDDGKTAKPFGRIFYTKEQSLVFYAYDLNKLSRRKRLVSFQAWGSGNDQPDVSLGLFSWNKKQKFWILHFDDRRTLARLNKVFVTVEPQGGSHKPTGKQILLAYLRIQPNHP